MAITGITITELTNIGTDIVANDVLPIVNIDIDETQKVTVQNLGDFVLGNLANVLSPTFSNLTVTNNTTLARANISGNLNVTGITTSGTVRTNNLQYANGQPWDLQEAAGSNGAVQFNSNNNFAASTVFVWNNSTNTLNVQNLNLLYANATVNQGTAEQVLGIVNQANQTLGWKTLPTNYMEVQLRDGNSYISSIVPVLRNIPIRTHSGGYVQIPAA